MLQLRTGKSILVGLRGDFAPSKSCQVKPFKVETLAKTGFLLQRIALSLRCALLMWAGASVDAIKLANQVKAVKLRQNEQNCLLQPTKNLPTEKNDFLLAGIQQKSINNA